jgi:hypothetical protein
VKKAFKIVKIILAVIIAVELLTILTLRLLIAYEHANLKKYPWKSAKTTVTLSQDGTLRVSGIGGMRDYAYHVRTYIGYIFKKWDWTYYNYYADVKWFMPDNDFYFDREICDKSGEIEGVDFSQGVPPHSGVNEVLLTMVPWFDKRDSISAIVIDNGVSHIGSHAFYNIPNLTYTSIVMPNSVKSIGAGAFRGTNITSVKIGDSVTSIGKYAFSNCLGLTSITIPAGVTSIEDWAFSGLISLMSITVKNPIPPETGEAVFRCVDENFVNLYVPENSIDAYRNAEI